jgi:4-amino-4-deoxy-L-arabinose transferase-like glycosyltransferase
MTLILFIALSLFSFYLSTEKNGTSEKKSIFLLLFYLFSALALLTKGLIGIVLPFGIATVYAEITNGWKGIKKVLSLRGTLIFLVVALPWYVMQTLLNGREFIDAFLIKHHFTRYLEGVSGHIAPLYYFVPVLIIGMFPWIAFFTSGIRNTIREKEPLNIFALVWFAFVFVFFSLSTTKLPNYILPAMPAVAILIASGMTKEDKVWRYSNIFLVVVASLMGTAFIVSGKYLLKMGFSDVAWTSIPGAVMAAMAALGLYSLYAKRSAYFPLAVLMLIFLSVLLMKAMPLASQYLQGTLYKYSLYAKYRLQEESQLFVCGTNNPSIVFYSGRTIVPLRKKRDLSELIGTSGSSIAIAKEEEMNMLRNRGFHLLDSDGGYALFERECRVRKNPGERNARNGIPK